jgi:hypothetical protein
MTDDQHRDGRGRYRPPDAHEAFAAGVGAALSSKAEKHAALLARLHPARPPALTDPEARDIARDIRRAGLGQHRP